MKQRKVKLNLPFVFVLAAAFLFSACGGRQFSSIIPTVPGAPNSHPGEPRSATGVITLSGPIVAKIKGGFTIESGHPCGYIHVYVNSSTTITGGSPAVGLNAQVTGAGTCATSITATSVTLSKTTLGTGTPSPAPSSSVAPYGSPTPYSSPGPPSSPIPYQNNAITVSGPITGTFAGGFTVNTGATDGYLHVYTNSSTVFAGGAPKAGLYTQATGAGSMSTSITARYVALYASSPSTVTVSGTALATRPYGFMAKASNAASSSSGYTSVPIVMNASTIVGGAPLAVGASVKITGLGARNEAILAESIVVTAPSNGSPTPTPGPILQKHLLTADYLGAPYGTTSIAWSAAAPYLTWAQTAWGSSNAIAATGIKTQLYADPNDTVAGVGDPLYTSDESTFAHDCNGNRVTDVYAGNITQYLMAIGSPAMQTLFANYVNHVVGYGSHFDAIYEDGAGPLSEKIYTPFSAMPCNYSDSEWLTYGEELNQVSSVPIIFNGLDAFNGQSPSMSLGLLQSSNTIGGNFEDCYSDDTQPVMTGWQWQTIEQTELDVAAQNKLFECQLRDGSAASSSMQARIYGLASFLLTYNPLTSILWDEFATNSGFHVEPEEQLVALDPLGATPSTVAGLQQTGGSYGRQYGRCYLAGQFVGACGVVVNPNLSAVPFPFPQYTHSLVLSGGGILDGGTVSTTGPAPGSTLPSATATIVFP